MFLCSRANLQEDGKIEDVDHGENESKDCRVDVPVSGLLVFPPHREGGTDHWTK